jgi:DNA polymerase-4
MDKLTILHSDLNCFFASVEIMLDPSLRGIPVAVAGSVENRHGIILAKSEEAKRFGVRTASTIGEAKALCPQLKLVPPHYDQYLKYSRLVRSIYRRYTDRVEPYGLDECWLNLAGCPCEDGEAVAEEIRRTVREETGLTVSIGVSFTKPFAKLGSDMKKPDAVTVISRENFRSKVWPLPASDLIFCGPATAKKLRRYGIIAIGDIANADPGFLNLLLGANGNMLYAFANGEECMSVISDDYVPVMKTIGNGITCRRDLECDEQVWRVIYELSQTVSSRLRSHHFAAGGIMLSVRSKDLSVEQHQYQLPLPTSNALLLARAAFSLFKSRYGWQSPIRALNVRAIDLCSIDESKQLSVTSDTSVVIRFDALDEAFDSLTHRFGRNVLTPASLLGDILLPTDGIVSVLPSSVK